MICHLLKNRINSLTQNSPCLEKQSIYSLSEVLHRRSYLKYVVHSLCLYSFSLFQEELELFVLGFPYVCGPLLFRSFPETSPITTTNLQKQCFVGSRTICFIFRSNYKAETMTDCGCTGQFGLKDHYCFFLFLEGALEHGQIDKTTSLCTGQCHKSFASQLLK